MKHILPLTYEPKIPDIINGRCNQTIRPKSEIKPKKIGDWVMFHGWSGKPYRSSWSFRTPYWKITDVYDVSFVYDGSPFDYYYLIRQIPWRSKADFYPLSLDEAECIAVRDGFDSFEQMVNQFKKMYGDEFIDMIFTIIRWDYHNKLEG